MHAAAVSECSAWGPAATNGKTETRQTACAVATHQTACAVATQSVAFSSPENNKLPTNWGLLRREHKVASYPGQWFITVETMSWGGEGVGKIF